MNRTAWTFALALLCLAACSRASGNSAVPAYGSRIAPSLALIVTADGGAKRWAQFGTGFCIMSDAHHSYFLTNKHVVALNPDRSKPPLGSVAPNIQVMLASDMSRTYRATVVRSSDNPDLAIVEIPVGRVPVVRLQPTVPHPGARIAIAGFPWNEVANFGTLTMGSDHLVRPEGIEPSVHQGAISAIQLGQSFIQYDAPTDHGNSGGPIFDPATGNVYGVVREVFSGDTDGDKPNEVPSVFNAEAISVLWGLAFIDDGPLRLDITNTNVHRLRQRCGRNLVAFDWDYTQWLEAHGTVRSMAAYEPASPSHSLVARFASAYSQAKLHMTAARAVGAERKWQRTMARDARFLRGDQAHSAHTLLQAMSGAQVLDHRLAQSLNSVPAQNASNHYEPALQRAARQMGSAGGCSLI